MLLLVELNQQSTISELKCQKYKTCHKHEGWVSAQSQSDLFMYQEIQTLKQQENTQIKGRIKKP